MKVVALDYDDTYTLAPELWVGLIRIMVGYGWKVVIVIYRDSSSFSDMDLNIPHVSDYIFTSGRAKQKHCEDNGLKIDIWIDDNPEAICFDYGNLPMQ